MIPYSAVGYAQRRASRRPPYSAVGIVTGSLFDSGVCSSLFGRGECKCIRGLTAGLTVTAKYLLKPVKWPKIAKKALILQKFCLVALGLVFGFTNINSEYVYVLFVGL